MQFNIITLFPELINNFFQYSILKKAIEKKIIKYKTLNPRDFTEDKHKVVDDEPYGGGSGMLLKPEPIYRALCSLKEKERGTVILLSAKGKLFSQQKALELAQKENITLISGRYEGIDERINKFIDEEISIGNFILMGGEVASLCVIESIARLIPGVIGKEESFKIESFSETFLEYPQYTRPRCFKNFEVPEILTSGNHKKINEWRKEKQIQITLKNRPDLIKNRNKPLSDIEKSLIQKFLPKPDIYIALIHHPVYNKKKEVVTTATTNMDIHDISRASKTFNIKKYFIVTPIKEQQDYIKRIINHWKKGYGYKYNPTRSEAFKIVEVVSLFDDCIKFIKNNCNKNLLMIGTSAKKYKNSISINKLKELTENNAILLIFGTGWGLTEEFIKKLDFMLEPIYGRSDYNHLSVRSAVSIILDRLLGY